MNLRAWLRSGVRVLRWPLLGLIRAYQFLLSPWIGNQCRFDPTCSNYAYEAIDRHGAVAGSYLAARRILRCHPWCAGGFDPVPDRAPRLFAGLVHDTPDAAEPPHPAAVKTRSPTDEA